MAWEQNILFRRKSAQTLPLYISPSSSSSSYSSASSNSSSILSKLSIKLFLFIMVTILLILCLIYGIFYFIEDYHRPLSHAFYEPSQNNFDSNEEEIISMEQIIKRHPYKLLEPSTNNKIAFNSKLLQQFNNNNPNQPPKNYDSWKDGIMNRQLNGEENALSSSSSPQLINYPPGEGGNVLFFSFHGKVGNGLIMNTITNKYPDLFVNGGDFLLHQHLTHNTTIEDKWASYDPSELTDLNKLKITNYITEIFQDYGNTRLDKRKILSVHMTDAWEGGVDISWLISEFQRVGRVTHLVIITRNPVRAKISDVASHSYHNILTESHECSQRQYLFEINSVEAVEMAVAQHSGIKEALSVPNLNIYGTSYETNIQTNILQTINGIVGFIWDASLPRQQLQELDQPYQPHLKCDLSTELSNFKELECVLGSSPLRWVIYDHQTNLLSFDQILESGDLFLEWVGKTDPKISNRCKERKSTNSKLLNELNKFKVQKRPNRCGHGGHTDVCTGLGRIHEYSCTQLLTLASSSSISPCNAMTYINGECYLHDTTIEDYWEGDCAYKNSYVAYL